MILLKFVMGSLLNIGWVTQIKRLNWTTWFNIKFVVGLLLNLWWITQIKWSNRSTWFYTKLNTPKFRIWSNRVRKTQWEFWPETGDTKYSKVMVWIMPNYTNRPIFLNKYNDTWTSVSFLGLGYRHWLGSLESIA